MNPDRIIGTAVLRPAKAAGGLHWLYFLKIGKKFDGVSWDSLPVYPLGGPVPTEASPSHFPTPTPWRYTIRGEMLDVTPSVHIFGFWHNDGQWSVKFVQADHGATNKQCHNKVLELNPEQDLAHMRESLQKWRD